MFWVNPLISIQSLTLSMKKIDFSVLLSVYKKEKPNYLDLSLESLYNQTVKAEEILLVKDGPLTPALENIIDKWRSIFGEKFKVIGLDKNRGLSAALNIGLKHCNNTWVTRMDTDDLCASDRFEKLIAYIKINPTADIIGSYARKIDENGNEGDIMKVPLSSEKIRKLIWTCPMIHPTVCYRKDKILSVGGYNENAGPRQDDYELWFRCAKAGLEFHNIPETLFFYRFNDENIRRNNLKVGFSRMKNGIKGNFDLGYGPYAYIGVIVPFLRALLPHPISYWFYKSTSRFNPRNK